MSDLRQALNLSRTMESVKSRMEFEKIDQCALMAARELHRYKIARIKLAPGDATLYDIVVIGPNLAVVDQHGKLAPGSKEYLVTLVNNSGQSYPWSGDDVWPDYVTDKWVGDGREWTGVVLAHFLCVLSKMIERTNDPEDTEVWQ